MEDITEIINYYTMNFSITQITETTANPCVLREENPSIICGLCMKCDCFLKYFYNIDKIGKK